MKVVVAGANGFLGRALMGALAGWDIVALDRAGRSLPNARTVIWDGTTSGPWEDEIDGADAVINLAGTTIAKKWTTVYRREILESRVLSTAAIGRAIGRSRSRPSVWLNGSAVGIYGDHGNETLDEGAAAGDDFMAHVCCEWEKAFFESDTTDVRRIALRSGVVLGTTGGLYPVLRRLTRLFLGGRAGSGRQWISWIHVDDWLRLTAWLLESQLIEGPVNLCSPEPVRNSDLMAALRTTIRRPAALHVPEWSLKLLGATLGPPSEMTLNSVRALPARIEASGGEFRHPGVAAALTDLESKFRVMAKR